jgi:glutamate-1-semialdehyde 2,1-aminomutase
VRAAFERQGEEIAAVVVEPVPANMGLVLPAPDFLQTLRALCDEHQSVLIFDEVITGFRIAPSGAQGLQGVVPDLSTFGKVIGGGLPVGAYGGRRDLMEQVAPLGEVFQAGTLSGNPVAVAAGLAVLDLLEKDGVFEALGRTARALSDGLAELADEAGVPFTSYGEGGLFGFHFHPGPIRNYADVGKADERRFRAFFAAMLDQGIYLAPSAFEIAFLTAAHGPAEIDETLTAARRAFKKAG